MADVKVALIGAGYMAEEHAKAFASLPGVRIAGVHSRSRDRAERLAAAHGAVVADSIPALWAATQADILVVAVPELAARGVCEAAFAHPWLCLLEKPAGYDLDDALAIQAAAEAAGARVHVAFNRRFYGATRGVAAALAADDGPRLITVLDQQSMEEARGQGARGGGADLDVCQFHPPDRLFHPSGPRRDHRGRGDVPLGAGGAGRGAGDDPLCQRRSGDVSGGLERPRPLGGDGGHARGAL